MKTLLFRLLCGGIAVLFVFGLCACTGGSGDDSPTGASAPAVSKPQIDADVSAALRDFYQNQLPSSVLRLGLKDANGEEFGCDYAMLQKSVFVDFDADGQKEIVLLYDVAEKTGVKNQDLIVFVDEADGKPAIVSTETGAYGASADGESYILTRYNSRVCKVRFLNLDAYEAAVVETFEDGAWKRTATAYRHLSDHDGVKLENDSCYMEHAGGDLLEAATGKKYYSREKFLNFRTPNENYNSFITTLLADTLLP